MEALPTMKADELADRAVAFAKQIAERLEDFNSKDPGPKMSEEAWGYIRENFGDKIPGPTPTQLIPSFEAVFCRYMASRYVIIP